MKTPAWLVYERCAAMLVAEQFGGSEVVLQPNAIVIGAISGKERQVDVLVDTRYPDICRDRLIVDAKHRTAKVDINDVETFEGMMRDCSANRGVIVCTAGYTDGAERRARDAITITMLTMDQALELDWSLEPCLGSCQQRVKGQRGMVLWDAPVTPEWDGQPAHPIRVGKCDGCHQFHVFCWSCGSKLIVPDAKVAECGCCQWLSVPEAAECDEDGTPESIWLMMLVNGIMVPVDRRPIHSPWFQPSA